MGIGDGADGTHGLGRTDWLEAAEALHDELMRTYGPIGEMIRRGDCPTTARITYQHLVATDQRLIEAMMREAYYKL